VEPDPDQGGKKRPTKSEEMHCFEMLDVLFRGLEASTQWRYFIAALGINILQVFITNI
jgi:hypothetical protein